MRKVGVVTGSNRGIGYSIVKGLAEKCPDLEVYLTARNEEAGNGALEKMQKELGNSGAANRIHFHQLDVTNKESIQKLQDHIYKTHGGLDILVNNAAVGFFGRREKDVPLEEQARLSMEVNYFGIKNVNEALFPLLRPHARVVTVASACGALCEIRIPELQQVLLSDNLQETEIENIIHQYLEAAMEGKDEEKGFPDPYSMSKVCTIAQARIQHRDFQKDPRKDIVVNSCCPGLVDTGMAHHYAEMMEIKLDDLALAGYPLKTTEEGADTPVYLALLPENAPHPRGELVADRKVQEWDKLPSVTEMLTMIKAGS